MKIRLNVEHCEGTYPDAPLYGRKESVELPEWIFKILGGQKSGKFFIGTDAHGELELRLIGEDDV